MYLDHDVRAVVGTTCWFTLLFEKVLAAARERGRPAASISEIWPNLRVLFGGGVAAAPYLPVIREFMGREDVTLVDTYNATEGGVYAASDFSGAPGLLMLPHRGTFFELVPLEQRTPQRPQAFHSGRSRSTAPTAIVVTTPSGLYAYELGDIVTFTSIAPLRIEFAGRLSGCLSLTQELTTHVEIERAVEHATRSCPSTAVEFGAAADVGVDGTAKSRYLLFVEFQEGGARETTRLPSSAAFDQGLVQAESRLSGAPKRRRRACSRPPLSVPLVERARGSRLFLEEVTRGNVQGKFPRIIDDTKKNLLWKHAARVR